MKFLLLTALVAMVSAWQPGQRDECNPVNVEGGSTLLPHEKHCQLYYTCSPHGNLTAMTCPGSLLFAYGSGIATCVRADTGITTYTCPKWPCNSPNDVGRRYPDTCCGKYWECTAINTFSEKTCNNGMKFDMDSERCSHLSTCQDSAFCNDNIRPSTNDDCRDSATSDPCTYRSEGWPFERQCPYGTAFDISTCSCSQFSQECTASGMKGEELLANKQPDAQCRASGRIQWSSNNLDVFSEKLNRNIDHYLYKSAGFKVYGNKGVFNNSKNPQPFIYDYFYNDNTLYAPLAITMTVKFVSDNLQVGTVYNLLENRWSTDPSNTHCNPVSLRFSAKYIGTGILGLRKWEFTISAIGENQIESKGTATVHALKVDYIRLVFTFGVTTGNRIGIGGTVTNMGLTGKGHLIPITHRINTDNRSMGSALMPNKCGFAIGRGLHGKISEFAVHEGCSNFSQL